ncbi:CYTH and CHAD domain-containing protein [Micromonospora sp. NPDC049559]|uniref:CYTH and CHAD domain-containing protein n=1 Tax=Micromonospora sp. NPDC049559 TaxID=3155923 RepID=UPI0034319A40
MMEEERKYDVPTGFVLPELAGAVPDGGRVVALPPVTLTATYFDTADLRLARAGVSLRHRKGDELPWTAKLPGDVPGVRHEISRAGKARRIPAELAGLVTVYRRDADLAPAAVVRTVRHAYELRDGGGRLLAELADDAVAVLDGKRVTAEFREIEVERKEGGRDLLDRVEAVLRDAGATGGGFVPKHVRALGEAAAGPADLVEPGELPAGPTAADVVAAAIRHGVWRILTHDPLVRLGEPLPDGDTAVHQMRVGCRRLRSDLRTFAALVEPEWARPLRDELRWLAGVLGAARDAEVLRARLRRTAAADPVCPLDPAAVERLDAALATRESAALAAVAEALRSPRYLALVEILLTAARAPRLTAATGGPATEVLPRLVARPWRKLVLGDRSHGGAADLDPLGPDERWHAVRIAGKRARYAVDAVAPVLGGGAPKLARALARVQNLLGEHQDAAVAAQTWLDIARAEPSDHTLAVTAGRLMERERAAISAARAEFPAAWRRATKGSRTKWLP